jgi:hypothetical protein
MYLVSLLIQIVLRSVSTFKIWIFLRYTRSMPVTVAARSKAWTVFAPSNARIVGWNLTPGMDIGIVCVCCVFVLFCVKVELLRLADPRSKVSYRLCIGSRNWKSRQCSTNGCRAIILQFNSILIYFRANSTAEWPITVWARRKKSKHTQSRNQGNL